MSEHIPFDSDVPHGFGDTTAEILKAIGVYCIAGPPNLPTEDLAGFDHIISDIDGVAQPYGGEVSEEVANWYAQLEDRVSFVSLNSDRYGIRTFLDRPAYVPKRALPVIGKVSLMLRAMDDAGVSPKRTLSLGDGLTDVAAAKLARIRYVALVGSQGAHPHQERVHRVYGRSLRLADKVSKARRR